jgi:hypothetical protein
LQGDQQILLKRCLPIRSRWSPGANSERKELKKMTKRLLIKRLPPDDPIFTRGVVVGQKNSSHFPKEAKKKTTSKRTRKSEEQGAYLDKK